MKKKGVMTIGILNLRGSCLESEQVHVPIERRRRLNSQVLKNGRNKRPSRKEDNSKMRKSRKKV